ncbi:hypothetical protein HacjB3_00875 [Halalkalicoccus jeotgali B3]|uniref:Uncharacterized protein n=1 Tax=Halalkalicoccus jeotgali (strain DSM 18796 / CECT 7217 / JCM 14584 / KCTC 4019 / B3) TaxID=795797 RepID=D8J4K6_HALJB|nr:hypothetical protein HacjB3_00875 [Halalkalicoccus jeotgali B3]
MKSDHLYTLRVDTIMLVALGEELIYLKQRNIEF